MLESYNPTSRVDQLKVITDAAYDTIKLIAEGFLNELLPFDITMDEITYMFNKYSDIVGKMGDAVGEFTDSQNKSSSSHLGYLVESFSTMIAAIPEMFDSLKQYFMDKAQNEMASEMTSIMN